MCSSAASAPSTPRLLISAPEMVSRKPGMRRVPAGLNLICGVIISATEHFATVAQEGMRIRFVVNKVLLHLIDARIAKVALYLLRGAPIDQLSGSGQGFGLQGQPCKHHAHRQHCYRMTLLHRYLLAESSMALNPIPREHGMLP